MIAMRIPVPRLMAVAALSLIASMALTSCNKSPAPGAAAASSSPGNATRNASSPPATPQASSTPSTQGPDLLTDPTTDAATPATDPATPTAVDSGSQDGGTTSASTPAAAATGSTHACSLITQAEAATALGADPGPGEETAAARGASSCIFGQSPSLVTVNLVPTQGKADLAHLVSGVPGGKLSPISGVGESGYSFAVGPSAGVWFVKGDALVAVAIVATGASNGSAANALTLAKLAAGRL